jgi:rare lipoprotein A
MNRVLSNLMAAFIAVATMSAAPVPTHPQVPSHPQAPSKPVVPKVSKANTPSGRAKSSPSQPYQVGIASWYGKQFHGKTTANGESFDMFELTAAHRELPLGTFVKVTNLRNGKWIIVRVNDRGPYVAGRIMDLSYGSARMLGFRSGIERVRLDVLHPQTVAMAQK